MQPLPQKRTTGKLLQDSGDAQEASTEEVPHQETPIVHPPPQKRTLAALSEEVVHQDTPVVQPPQQRTFVALCTESCDNCSHCGRL